MENEKDLTKGKASLPDVVRLLAAGLLAAGALICWLTEPADDSAHWMADFLVPRIAGTILGFAAWRVGKSFRNEE